MAIGVGAALVVDLDAAREMARVVPQGDGLADQRGIDLEDDAVETDRAVLLDLALLLEEEEVGEVLRRQRHVGGGAGPLLARGRVLQAAVGRVEVLVLDPGPEPRIERLERLRVVVEQRGQQPQADGPKPALELAAPLRQEGPAVDQRDAELRADQREVARAKRRPVVDVQALRTAAVQDRPLEDGQERGHGLAAGEGRVRDDARRIVEQRDQVRLVAAPVLLVEHGRAVHDVAHPELVGGVEAEAAPVLAGGRLGRPRHQAVAAQQPMDGRGRQRQVGGDEALVARGADHQRDAVGRVLLFERAELIGHGLRQGAGVALIGAGPRLERRRSRRGDTHRANRAAFRRRRAGAWSRESRSRAPPSRAAARATSGRPDARCRRSAIRP